MMIRVVIMPVLEGKSIVVVFTEAQDHFLMI